MFSGKTMMVVGAGASKEVGFPIGSELKTAIAELLDMNPAKEQYGDRVIFDALKALGREEGGVPALQQYVSAASHIRDSMPAAHSIDYFLHSHRGDNRIETCGKLAIARAILQAEKRSKLFVSPDNAFNELKLSKLTGTWYLRLAELLFSCHKEDLANRLTQIEFIVFNYDRCIEQFLYWGLRIYFKISEKEAAEYVKKVKIYHPYGSVGRLPWQEGKGVPVPFGSENYDLISVAKQVKTFTEGTDPNSSDIIELRNSLDESDIAIFLGFGFHKLNIALITPETRMRRNRKRLYATAKGLSEHNAEIAEGRLSGLCSQMATVHLSDCFCCELFERYYFSLDT